MTVTDDEYKELKSLKKKYESWIRSSKAKIDRYNQKIENTYKEIDDYENMLMKVEMKLYLYENVNEKES